MLNPGHFVPVPIVRQLLLSRDPSMLSAPLLAELRQKLLRWKQQLLPKHPMAEAVNYTLSQWMELNVFCSNGAVPIDNNISNAASGI